MNTLKNIINKIEAFAPPSLAQFDYVGLLQGEEDQKISKIGLTLDYSLLAINKAIESGCQLLITHHGPTEIRYPLIGNNLEKITAASKSKLSVYRCHLNLDFCKNGIITELCNILEIPAIPVTTHYESYKITGGVFLAEDYRLSLDQLTKRIAKLKVTSFRIAGGRKEHFKRIAITSGKGFIPEFFDQLKPEVYIAGEFEQEAIKYAEDLGIMLVELSHHASEVRALEPVAKTFEKLLKTEAVLIEIPDSIRSIKT